MAFSPPRSAYVHIPFCHRRCFYCDFPVVPLGDRVDGAMSRSVAQYLGWLEEEISTCAPGPPLSTLYIGGGTPSLLSTAQMAWLLALLNHQFGLAPGAEITIELDPADASAERLEGYRAAGVNRVSLGVQSFDDGLLAAMGRRHRRQDINTAVALLKNSKGLCRWSLDLISGLPGLTPALWEATLDQALSLAPPHVSLYDLTIGEGTVFDRWLEQGRLCLPPETTSAAMLDRAAQRLEAAGLRRYEISSFARPGHACRHNRVYWGGGCWWGFGMGAASSVAGQRLIRPRTRRSYRAWLRDLRHGAQPNASASAKERLEDLLITGLRRSEGVNRRQLAQQCSLPPEVLTTLSPRLERACAQGLLCCEGPCLRLSQPQGFRLSNQVLADCLLWVEELFAPGGAAHDTSLVAPV